MPTLAVLPIKSLGAAKSRLGARLDAEARTELAHAMLCDVLEALGRARELDEVAVVTGDPRAAAAGREHGAEIVEDADGAGQSHAAGLGIARALAVGCDRVLLVPGDTPLLSAEDVDELLARSAAARLGAAIVPDRHGTGTNALALSPPGAIPPSFGPGSRARHERSARAAGVAHAIERVASLGHDVDTPEDLDALAARLREAGPATAPRTTAALSLPAQV